MRNKAHPTDKQAGEQGEQLKGARASEPERKKEREEAAGWGWREWV